MEKVDYQQVWDEACAAFKVAYEEAKPAQYVVGIAKSFFGNDIDYSKQVYVMEGNCGFAWVNVGDGRKPFVRWMKERGYARSSYYGGFQVWSSNFAAGQGQVMERKEAGCRAAAQVFEAYGFKAYVDSRMD